MNKFKYVLKTVVHYHLIIRFPDFIYSSISPVLSPDFDFPGITHQEFAQIECDVPICIWLFCVGRANLPWTFSGCSSLPNSVVSSKLVFFLIPYFYIPTACFYISLSKVFSNFAKLLFINYAIKTGQPKQKKLTFKHILLLANSSHSIICRVLFQVELWLTFTKLASTRNQIGFKENTYWETDIWFL